MKEMEKKREEKEKSSTLLIASYREKYTESSLQKMKKVIENKQPDRIVILKIIKREPTPEVVEAKLGREEMQDFLDSVLEDKKQQADEYASELIDMTDELDIPTEVHLRKGEDIAEEVIKSVREMEADHVVIHTPEKGPLGKLLEGSTGETIKRELGEEGLTLLS